MPLTVRIPAAPQHRPSAEYACTRNRSARGFAGVREQVDRHLLQVFRQRKRREQQGHQHQQNTEPARLRRHAGAVHLLAETMQLDVGPPPFRQAQARACRGLVGGPPPMELWPGDKRRPYTTSGDRRHHSHGAVRLHGSGCAFAQNPQPDARIFRPASARNLLCTLHREAPGSRPWIRCDMARTVAAPGPPPARSRSFRASSSRR